MGATSIIRRFTNRAKDILFMPGTAALWCKRLQGKVMALVYHRVDDPSRYDFLERGGTPVIRPEALASELSWLQSLGARFLTFADLRNGNFPADDEFGVVITFDDGFRDNYTTGFEVLDSLGIKAVIFQCGAMIDGRELIPEHTLYWLASRPETASMLLEYARNADWPGSRELSARAARGQVANWIRRVPANSLKAVLTDLGQRSSSPEWVSRLYPNNTDLRRAVSLGHEIGSHGYLHLCRATLDTAAFEEELSKSTSAIEAATGVSPAAFSYPFNAYLPGDREICGRYFQQVVTVDGQPIRRDSDPLTMGRFTWPGPPRNGLRQRRWLLTGGI